MSVKIAPRGLVDSEWGRCYGGAVTPPALLAEAPDISWMQPVADALSELVNLPANWDSYGARPIKGDRAIAAFDLLQSIMRDGVPVPSVVPTRRGTIQIEWHARQIDLEIDVCSDTDAAVTYEDLQTGESRELELKNDFRPLAAIMRTLAARR